MKPSEVGGPDLSTLKDWQAMGAQAARMYRWEWFVIDQFIRGNQNIRGNPNDNSITVTKGSNNINFPINKMYVAFRAVRAYVTRHKPIIEIDVDESKDPNVLAYARRAASLIRRDNKLNNGVKLNKNWVFYGVKYGLSYRQMGYDPKRKCCIRWTVDPFDLDIVSKTGEFADAPAIVKNVVRTIEYIKNKYPDYTGTLAPDNELAADEYKRLGMLINNQDGYGVTTTEIAKQTKIVHEAWYRVFEPNSKGGFINKCTFVDTGKLDHEETPYDEFPFIPYYTSQEPNELYPDGHMKHTVSPQRMFNLLNTQELEYNHVVNRGKYVTEKGSGFSIINTQDGQIIRVNKNAKLISLNPPSVNANLPRQRDNAERWIDDTSGQHDVSLGSIPPRITAGVAIDSIQQGDSNNISDLRDNFEIALAEEAAWILKIYSLFEHEGIVINDVAKNDLGQPEVNKVALVGQKALQSMKKPKPNRYYISGKGEGSEGADLQNNGEYCEVFEILADNKISVSIQSQLGETKQAKMELLLKLKDAGLPLATVLKFLEFPNAADISERLAEEALADMAIEAMKAQQTAPAVEPSRLPPEIAPAAPPIQ